MADMLKELKKFFGLPVEDRKFEPSKYKIETSGWPEAGGQRITEYISSAAQKGATFLEITANQPSSFTQHDIDEIKIYQKRENMKVNIHAAIPLRTAMAEEKEYRKVEDYMEGYIEVADELDSDYINLHTSAFVSPELGKMRGVRRESMVHPDGRRIEEFIKDLASNHKDSETFTWLVDEIGESRTTVPLLQVLRKVREDYDEVDDVDQARDRFASMDDEEQLEYRKEVFAERVLNDDIPFSETTLMNEYRTYKLIGWWMYEDGNKIWKSICGDKNPKELEKNEDIKKMVDAVAGRYVKGHINHWMDDLKSADVKLTLETPDPRDRRFVGEYRLLKPKRIYHVVKDIDSPYVWACIDFEHIAAQGLDVREEIEDAPSDFGELVYLVHLSGNPSPGHEHKPLLKGEIEVYEMLWILRQRGFTSGYLNFERGSGGGGGQGQQDDPWQRSIPILKDMAMYLENDVGPDDLPPEFYGYSDKEFKRDKAVVESHMFDPIEGLIESPEMRDTFLGNHAIRQKRKKPEEWKKEEHR